MQRAIMIGAGNIGRGFIGALLAKSGYQVLFADVNQSIIDAINEKKQYTVHIKDTICRDFSIQNVRGISSAGEALSQAVCDCDLITTAVGVNVLPIVAKPLAEGLRRRMRAGNKQPLHLIACENAIRATSQLKKAIFSFLNSEEQAFATRFIGFADCAVDRIVPRALFNDVLDVAAEEYYEWDIESTNWKGKRPQISDANFVKDLSPYIERKLFTLNSGHAICAYLGFLHGHETVLQSISDRAISDIVYQAMQESGNGLIQKFALDETKHHAYIDRIVARFQNPYLEDSVLRVGRDPIRKLSADERLIKPLMTAVSYGCGVDHLLFGAAAALHFVNSEDLQSVRLQQLLQAKGVMHTLCEYSGFTLENPLTQRITDIYRALNI